MRLQWPHWTPSEGRGVNVLPTVDGSGLAALVTNYQAVDRTGTHTVTFDPGTLPWAGRGVRVDRYLIDAATSNYNADPARSELQRVESVTLSASAAKRRVFTLGPNAVSLLVYAPLPLRYETETVSLTLTGTSSGGWTVGFDYVELD